MLPQEDEELPKPLLDEELLLFFELSVDTEPSSEEAIQELLIVALLPEEEQLLTPLIDELSVLDTELSEASHELSIVTLLSEDDLLATLLLGEPLLFFFDLSADFTEPLEEASQELLIVILLSAEEEVLLLILGFDAPQLLFCVCVIVLLLEGVFLSAPLLEDILVLLIFSQQDMVLLEEPLLLLFFFELRIVSRCIYENGLFFFNNPFRKEINSS